MRNQPSPRSQASHPNHERARSSIVFATIVTLTAVASDFGDLRLYPAGSPVPSSSTINFALQKVRANNAVITLSGGQIGVQCDMSDSAGQTHFLLDIMGYFQ